MRISPVARITVALLVISCSILVIAQLTSGVFFDPNPRIMQLRHALAQSLAAQSAVLLQNGDRNTLRMTFEAARRTDSAIRSIAVRTADGALAVVAGDHATAWIEPQGEQSTSDEIFVPLQRQQEPWGRFEMIYTAPDRFALSPVLFHPFTIVLMHFLVLGSLFYWVYLRRALAILDPSAVISQRVRAAFNCMAEGVVVLDRQGRVVMTNTVFDLLSDPAAVLVGKELSMTWLAKALPEDASQHPWAKAMQTAAASTGNYLEINAPLRPKKFIVNCAPILGPKGTARGCVVTFDDVSAIYHANESLAAALRELEVSRNEIERKHTELEFTASHDALSGCLIRSAGMARLDMLIQQARRDAQPLLVMMVDVDRFKAINDGFGHAIGDKVIGAVGASLVYAVRKTDFVSRHGGDEFVVSMPGCDAVQAMAIAQGVCQTVTQRCTTDIPALAGFSVTVSIGVASFAPQTDDLATLMHRVDAALYSAKAAGRNTVVSA
jgi:diguanylate cyclase (GGDEF)-like protein